MQMHTVIFLVEYPGNVGKPERSDDEQKKDQEVDMTFFENSSLELH